MLNVLCEQEMKSTMTYRPSASQANECVDIKQQTVLALLYVAFLHSDR